MCIGGDFRVVALNIFGSRDWLHENVFPWTAKDGVGPVV